MKLTTVFGHLIFLPAMLALGACGGSDQESPTSQTEGIQRLRTQMAALTKAGSTTSQSSSSVPRATQTQTTVAATPTGTVVAPVGSVNAGSTAAAVVVVPAATTLPPTVVATPVQASTSSPSDTCGVADIGGWTIPVPTPVDAKVAGLRDLKQPGSRLIYISSSAGSDQQGAVYFWNGSAVIDELGKTVNASGVAYGSNPMNPSSAVKPFKRWAYAGPRGNTTSDIGSRGTAGEPQAAGRSGYPDWWMFKRGDTFDLSDDLLSFAREADPNVSTVYGSLAVPGGRSATERQVVGAYGDTCVARPRFIHPMLGFLSRHHGTSSMAFKNVAYLSLHFDGNDRRNFGTYTGISLSGQPADSKNILFEDMWVDAVPSSIQATSAQITIRRSILSDAFDASGGFVQGLYYEGKRDSVLSIEESIFLRSGFKYNPKTKAWPPSGDQSWSIFSRNLYLNGENNNLASHFTDSVSMIGASGDQFRQGMRVERNFFYQGYVQMGASGGYDAAEGPTGTLKDNVIQKFVGTGTTENRGQPGWGFYLYAGASGVDVTGNIVTGSQHIGDYFAFGFNISEWDCRVRNVLYPTRGNRVFGNILDSGNASSAVRVHDGAEGSCSTLFAFPSVKGNLVNDNVMINKNAAQHQYVTIGKAVGTVSDMSYTNNKMFTTRAAAASSLGWKDADRTLKSYLVAKGVAVTSADGYPEYVDRAFAMRRGKWRQEWTGRALVDYFRDGFSMTAVQ